MSFVHPPSIRDKSKIGGHIVMIQGLVHCADGHMIPELLVWPVDVKGLMTLKVDLTLVMLL